MRRAMIVLAMLAVSCSGGEKSKTEETVEKEVVEKPAEQPPTETEEPPDQGEGIPWGEKSPEQKGAYMKLTVKPKMEALFTEYDGAAFADVKCSTCHGENAKEREFEMPSPDLPKMDFERWETEEPEMMAFMQEKVVPEMAALLDMQPYDPQTKEGFGCGGCHPSE